MEIVNNLLCHERIISLINRKLMGRGKRLTMPGEMMIGYFAQETSMIGNDRETHNVSSKIIEFLFGDYKEQKSPNRMYGVTGIIHVMPLGTQLCTLKWVSKFDFKAAFERNLIADVKVWGKDNLHENLAAKRMRVLKPAC